MNPKYDKARTSQDIKNEFNETCFKLGQEIRNEIRAKENQTVLIDRQEELEKAFSAAVVREQEAAAAKSRAEEQDKAFKAKAAPGNDASLEPVEDTTRTT